MIVQGLDFSGNPVSLDKAKIDFIKLMLIIYSGEVFGYPKYGHNYLDIYDDDSVTDAISRANSILTGSGVSVSYIDRSNPRVLKITLSGQAEPIEISLGA